ncbi:MAG TPA: nucleotidyltransferase domain-containing protein [bacterium]|nr:nucleotidyltransferase domain-containing protein [bacterium]HPP08549.1 nucleotidyltransferase domain-containing protein [bacterium]
MRDKNLERIKEVIKSIFPDAQIILFGSRARGDYKENSDYDIMVIIEQELNIKDKRQYSSYIRKKLIEKRILADVLIRTKKDANYYQDKIGSITRIALLKGVRL